MNIIKSKKGLAAICLSLLLCLLLQTHAFAGQHYGTDPTLNGPYDTHNKCEKITLDRRGKRFIIFAIGIRMPMSKKKA